MIPLKGGLLLRFRQKIYVAIIGTLTVIMLIMAVLQVRGISRMGETVEETMSPALLEQAKHTALLESESYSREIDGVMYALRMLADSYAKSIEKEYSFGSYIPADIRIAPRSGTTLKRFFRALKIPMRG